MPALKVRYGRHENVPALVFGSGDIQISLARRFDNGFITKLLFTEAAPSKIGSEVHEYAGHTSDMLPNIKLVMEFNKPESIAILIESLNKIQIELFDQQYKTE